MDWASAIWAWLDANSKQLSAVASLVFGLSSAVVAWFAYRLNRRNNVGSEPMAFFTWWKIEPRGEADPLMTVRVEFWNRRKYPVVVRRVTITPTKLKFSGKGYEYSKGWIVVDGAVQLTNRESIEPVGRKVIEVEGPVSLGPGQSVDLRTHRLLVCNVNYTDPWEEADIEVSSHGESTRPSLAGADWAHGLGDCSTSHPRRSAGKLISPMSVLAQLGTCSVAPL